MGTEEEALLGENRSKNTTLSHSALGGAVRPVSYSLPRSVLRDICATVVRILAYMGGLGLLAILAVSFFRTETVVAAVESAPHTDWINIDRPHPAFELQMPEWAATNVNYYILRRPRDGGRKDVLTFGDPTANGPYVAFEIYRPGSADERFIDAPSEIAARIVAFTVTDDVKAAGQLDTKFGTMSLVDFAIASGSPLGRQAENLAKRPSYRTLAAAALSRLRPAVRCAIDAGLRLVLQPGRRSGRPRGALVARSTTSPCCPPAAMSPLPCCSPTPK